MDSYNKNEIFASFEAILFASGEPVDLEKIAKALDMPLYDTTKLMEEYASSLEDANRGVKVVYINDGVQMVTKSCYHEVVSDVISKGTRALSQSALEVLSVIAYNQPVTKAAIDNVRGVDSYNSLSRLLERDLIEVRGKLNTIGHPRIYGTTDEFLRMFGLITLDDLPKAEGETLKNIAKEKEMTLFDILPDDEETEIDPEQRDFEI